MEMQNVSKSGNFTFCQGKIKFSPKNIREFFSFNHGQKNLVFEFIRHGVDYRGDLKANEKMLLKILTHLAYRANGNKL